ncbi:MAG TPA: M56 family metallopeptidase [Gemmatimonadales bacterium]|nr:M56 family metallopeptidase [Gemmatimonadales bacterium]
MIAILADAFVKATIVLLLAAGVALLLRRSSAAMRHHVWALACAGVLVLPLATALLPNWRVNVWPKIDVPVAFNVKQIAGEPLDRQPTAIRRADVQPLAPATTRTETPRTTVTAIPEGVARFEITPDWTSFIVPVWLGGVAIMLALVGIGMARVWWLSRVTQPARDDAWPMLVEELSRELGLTRYVRVLQAQAPAMPMTWGIRRPAILLPAEADEWPAERRRDVLLHELAHVKRHDFLIQLLARLACAVYWFHPLVWLAATRLREERERACDDQVLRAGATPSSYATHLLEIARGLRAAPATSLASVAMARPAQLATRLIDVLDARRCRDTLTPRSVVPAWIAAIAVVVPLATIAPSVAEPSEAASIDTTPLLPGPRSRPMSPRLSAAIRTPASKPAARDTLKGCATNTKHNSSSTSQENDDLMIFVNLGGCSIRLAASGKFTFTGDFSDIATVARGGYVTLTVDYGEHDRRVTIRPNGERLFKVDGSERPYDAEAKAWLSETLTYLLRRTGYMAEERARWILDTKGIQGLVDEFGQLQGDYTRRIYYQAAIESGKLDVAGYERLIGLAAQTIASDYELAELLIAVSKAQPLTERMQAGFAAAARSIGSDYERHRVLSAALSRPGLTPAVQAAMLDAAAEIGSDYELATLLIELNEARPIDEQVRPAYFKAASSVGSDYEHRRVLSAVVEREGTSRAILADVLTSARNIDSDYELAELLIEVGGSYALDAALRPPFFAAAASLNSDYEHARALGSLLRGQVPREIALAILESAKGISSDHEMSELLIAVMQHVALDDDIRAAIRADAQLIGSQYDRGRVFEALSQE